MPCSWRMSFKGPRLYKKNNCMGNQTYYRVNNLSTRQLVIYSGNRRGVVEAHKTKTNVYSSTDEMEEIFWISSYEDCFIHYKAMLSRDRTSIPPLAIASRYVIILVTGSSFLSRVGLPSTGKSDNYSWPVSIRNNETCKQKKINKIHYNNGVKSMSANW